MKDNFFKKSYSKFQNTKLEHKNRNSKFDSSPNSNNFFIKSTHPSTSKESETSDVHNSQKSCKSKTDKKPFDKKKYRLQKYSNKYQVQQWEDKRKKAVLRNYYKTLSDDKSNPYNKVYKGQINATDDTNKEQDDSVTVATNNLTESNNDSPNNSKQKKSKPFQKAQQEFQRIKEEKEKKKEAIMKMKNERQEAMQAYKKKKAEKYKKLNKKTKRGQPIMKGRIEMLLEKIQNSID